MKFTLNWMREYCDVDLSVEELAERLTAAGLPVDGVERAGEDFCLEVEVTANRPDCLSLIGLAREIAGGGDLRLPQPRYTEAKEPVASHVSVEVEDAELCPRYTARVVTGVRVGPSPRWLAERLAAIGLRPVNNVVDISNYVLMETGQPLHIFDLEKIGGGRIVVRRAMIGETIKLIDGRTHNLAPSMLLIADAERPVAVAGVMGGAGTEVSAKTTSVLVESARFDPAATRRTARMLRIAGDSSYRFERGVDPAGVDFASRRACGLIAELCGGSVARGVIDLGGAECGRRTVALRIGRIKRVLGIDVDPKEVAKRLGGIGFVASGEGPTLSVEVPSFRPDVTREIDLIEEVARLIGYDRIPESEGISVRLAVPPKEDTVARAVRQLFVADGYHEALTITFVEPQGKGRISPWSDAEPLTIVNPINTEQNALRLGMLPAMMRARKVNQDASQTGVRLFELGTVYLPRPGEKLPEERPVLAAVNDDGFYALKGTLTALFERLGFRKQPHYRKGTWPALEPGASAEIMMDDETLGYIGLVTRETAGAFGLKSTPAYAELSFAHLIAPAGLQNPFVPLPKFPPIDRELSLVLDKAVAWEEVEAGVHAAAPGTLAALRYLDAYRGDQIAAGKKAVLIGLTFRAADRTLTADEADDAVAAILAALGTRLGATLRS